MGDSLYVASSGAAARMQQLDIVANNLANADTVGFRADRALFETALDRAWTNDQGQDVPGGAVLSQVQHSGQLIMQNAGSISRTGGALDTAILGDGFFSVELPDGVGYTRAGSFRIDAEGQLVTQSGFPVMGEGGPIVVGSEAVRIDADGSLVGSGGNAVGRLELVRFEDPNVLSKRGQNIFRAPQDVVPTPIDATLEPESLEQSNVEPLRELATLVILQRAFDASMQTLEASDELSQKLIQEVSN